MAIGEFISGLSTGQKVAAAAVGGMVVGGGITAAYYNGVFDTPINWVEERIPHKQTKRRTKKHNTTAKEEPAKDTKKK